jgi:Raf kinase inhibitor-like YbhB/YbcL family protein
MYHRAMRHRPGHVARLLPLLAALSATAACGGDDDGDDGEADDGTAADAGDDGGDGADAAPQEDGSGTLFVLTSTAFEEGGEIPLRHVCTDQGGDDVSPALSWSGGPDAAGYAVVLTDRSFDGGFVHSVLWDVPGDVTELPEDIEKVAEPGEPPGSKQTLAYDGTTRGYRGPCPPKQHTYEFALYALDELPLTGVTLESTSDELVDVLTERALVSTTLTGTFTPP